MGAGVSTTNILESGLVPESIRGPLERVMASISPDQDRREFQAQQQRAIQGLQSLAGQLAPSAAPAPGGFASPGGGGVQGFGGGGGQQFNAPLGGGGSARGNIRFNLGARGRNAFANRGLGGGGGGAQQGGLNPLASSLNAAAQAQLQDPFTFGQDEIANLFGQQQDLINQQLENTIQKQRSAAAQRGLGDSGTLLAQEQQARQAAGEQLAGAQRDILQEAAVRRQQDLQRAFQNAAALQGQQAQQQTQLAGLLNEARLTQPRENIPFGFIGDIAQLAGSPRTINTQSTAFNPPNQMGAQVSSAGGPTGFRGSFGGGQNFGPLNMAGDAAKRVAGFLGGPF